MLRNRIALVFGIAAALAAFGGGRPASATNFTVMTIGNSFSPASVSIHVGDSVTFMNTGQGFHNVHADNNSFRCANGCDGHGGDGSPSSSAWSSTVTFNSAGTVAYYCEIHGAPGGAGMSGTIDVMAATGGPGALGFSSSSYSVPENAGGMNITVQRSGGSSGAVSVQYATSDGTAMAGTHYRAASGMLNWADGDSASKTFNVQVLDDGVPDGSHNVNLSLSSPSGGATLGTSSAVLSITNTDAAAAAGGKET